MTGLIADRHNHTNITVLNAITDVNGKLNYNGKDIGDVIMSSIDSNLDGIVDKASTLDGLSVTVTALNYLQGAKGNIQNQIDALGGAINLKDVHKSTYTDLTATTGMLKGDAYIVDADETQQGNKTWYVYNGTTWVYMGTTSIVARNFNTQPINLATETTGILQQTKVDLTGIAKTTDIPSITNLATLLKISDVSGVLNYNNNPIFNSNMVIDDNVVVNTKSWSSSKINSVVGQVGVKNVSENGRDNGKFLIYDKLSDKLVYTKMFVPDWEQNVSYDKGNVVWYNGGAYRCKTAHVSSLLLDTDIDNWEVFSGGGGAGGVAQLKEVSGQTTIAGNDSIYMHLSVGFNKYDIRTVYAKSLQDNNIVVEIYNQTNGGFKIYESLELPELQDTLMSPCEDRDSTKCLHVKIFNKGNISTDVNYLFYVTSLS
jgi:hypothetical protein